MEILPILHDLEPYLGSCLNIAQPQLEYSIKQDKDNADHVMLLGD